MKEIKHPTIREFEEAKKQLAYKIVIDKIVSCRRCGWPVLKGSDCQKCGTEEPDWN